MVSGSREEGSQKEETSRILPLKGWSVFLYQEAQSTAYQLTVKPSITGANVTTCVEDQGDVKTSLQTVLPDITQYQPVEVTTYNGQPCVLFVNNVTLTSNMVTTNNFYVNQQTMAPVALVAQTWYSQQSLPFSTSSVTYTGFSANVNFQSSMFLPPSGVVCTIVPQQGFVACE
jgi:hypothetical protein